MGIAGPRLDSPSAIGDEGRPRAASLWIATAVVAALVGVVGVLAGEPRLLPSLALLVGPAIAGVALLERETFGQQFVGHLLLVTFGAALSLLVLVGPVIDRALFVVAACALALTGVAAAWADVGSDDLERAVRAAARTYVAMVASALGVAAVGLALVVGREILSEIDAVSAPVWSVVGVLAIVAAVAAAVRLALGHLPLRQLSARSRRAQVGVSVTLARRWLRRVSVGAALLIAVVLALHYGGVFGPITAMPGLARLLGGLSSPLLVWPLVAVGGLALLAALLAAALRRLTRQIDDESTQRRVATIAGVAVTIVGSLWVTLLFLGVVRGLPRVIRGLSTTGAPVAALVLVGPLALVLLGGLAMFAGRLGVLPARATGPAVAATGLLLVAIGIGSGEPALTFACIAGAGLVWDVSTFGLGLTAELGHLPETRRLELFHGAVAVGVAVGAVLLAVGLETLRTGPFVAVGSAGGAVLIAFGAVLLLVPLRG